MASFVFNKAREAFLSPGTLGTTSGDAIDWTDDNIKTALVRASAADPTSSDTSQFLSSFATRVADSGNLASKTVTNGYADAADVTFTAVASGAAIDWLLVYKDTGSAASSPVIARLDLSSAVTPNGGDITIQFNASGLFRL